MLPEARQFCVICVFRKKSALWHERTKQPEKQAGGGIYVAVNLFLVAGMAGLIGALVLWMNGAGLVVAILTYVSVGCGLPLFVLIATYRRGARKPANSELELAAETPKNQ